MNRFQYTALVRWAFSMLALCMLAGCVPSANQQIGSTTAANPDDTLPAVGRGSADLGEQPVWQGKSLNAWLQQLTSGSETERAAAFEAIKAIGKPAARPLAELLLQDSLPADLQDLSGDGRTMTMLLLLVELGPDESAAEFLIPHLNTRTPRKRGVVAAALAAIGGERAMGALLIDTSVRTAHGDMKHPGLATGDRLVISILKLRHAQANRGPDDIVAVWKGKYEGKQADIDNGGPYTSLGYKSVDDFLCMMRILKEIGKPSVEPLAPLVEHENQKLRRHALATLCLIADDVEEPHDVYPHIISALDSQDEALRRLAASALKSQTGEDFGEHSAKWRQWLQGRRAAAPTELSAPPRIVPLRPPP